MGHLISAHNKSPAGDVASVRIAKQKGSIIRQNRSRIKTNDIVFPEKYFREAIIMKPDIKTGIPTMAGFYDLVKKTGFETSQVTQNWLHGPGAPNEDIVQNHLT